MNIKYRLLCKRLIEERKRVGVIQYYNVLVLCQDLVQVKMRKFSPF